MTQMDADWEEPSAFYPRHLLSKGLNTAAMKDEYPHREFSAAIIGAAMEVLNGLKPGLDEKIYENSLVSNRSPKVIMSSSNGVFQSIIAAIWSAH